MSFSAARCFPKFVPSVHDYVVRCQDAPVTVAAHASGGWQVPIGGGPYRGGDFSEVVPLVTGRAFTVKARKVGLPHVYR